MHKNKKQKHLITERSPILRIPGSYRGFSAVPERMKVVRSRCNEKEAFLQVETFSAPEAITRGAAAIQAKA